MWLTPFEIWYAYSKLFTTIIENSFAIDFSKQVSTKKRDHLKLVWSKPTLDTKFKY